MGASASVGSMVVGTGIKAFGQFQDGQDQRKYYNQQAQLAQYQVDDTLVRGEIDEKKMRRQTERTIGSQRVNLAAQGVDINSGSALDTQADAAYLGELDAKTIQTNAKKEAWGYKVQSNDLKYRGKLAQHKGRTDSIDTILGAASSMLMQSYGGGSGGKSGGK